MTDAEFTARLHYDSSLLRHFTFPVPVNLNDALTGAISLYGRTKPTATWFWFNGTPAPIQPDDTPDTLGHRWARWRAAHQNGTILNEINEWALRPRPDHRVGAPSVTLPGPPVAPAEELDGRRSPR